MKKIEEIKVSEESLKNIVNQKDSRVDALFLNDEDFKKLENPSYDLEKNKDENH